MNNNDHSTVLHVHRFAPGRTRETPAAACVPLPGQPETHRIIGSFNPETTVTFVRKKAERTLNEAAFVDNMSKD